MSDGVFCDFVVGRLNTNWGTGAEESWMGLVGYTSRRMGMKPKGVGDGMVDTRRTMVMRGYAAYYYGREGKG